MNLPNITMKSKPYSPKMTIPKTQKIPSLWKRKNSPMLLWNKPKMFLNICLYSLLFPAIHLKIAIAIKKVFLKICLHNLLFQMYLSKINLKKTKRPL